MSSTSGSRSSSPTRTRRRLRAPARRTSRARPGSTRSEAGGPTRAGARCSSRGSPRASGSRTGAGTPGGNGRALLQGCERGLARLLHRAPPLERDERLDARVAALAGADGVVVALALLEPVVLPQPGDDALVRLALVSPASSPARLVHPAVRADHRQPGSSCRGRSRSRCGSWPGVILSAPVPNAGSTRSSAITGTRRSTKGTTTSLPTASR